MRENMTLSKLYVNVNFRGNAMPKVCSFFRRSFLFCAVFAPQVLNAQTTLGDVWPGKKPITLVAVFPPGGSVDQVARILAQPLQAQLGQTVVVENKGGASGAIGAAAVAKAEGDGYTFAVVFDTHAVNPSLIPNLPYDTLRDLPPVSLIGAAQLNEGKYDVIQTLR
jgi:tripartite-type tricarboxylate transporter receptor subunit TctC